MKHAYLIAALVAIYLPGARAVDFNTEALKAMQEEGLKIVEESKNLRAYKLPTGKCLHVAGDVTKPGANLVIHNCNPNLANQKWRFDDQGRLVNQGGKCVGVAGDPTKPGANVRMQNCVAAKAQRWRQDDKKRLVNGLNKCLHAVGDAKTPGGNVVTTNCNASPNQVWN
jgi:hypothetical protein